MSPPKFVENENAISRRKPYENSGEGCCGGAFPPPPSLKINKDSHSIKKRSSPSSTFTSAADIAAAKPRHPVIIYTHSPKVIHTNPKDFMALVQKLTGMSRSEEDSTSAGDRRGKSPAIRAVSDHGEELSNCNRNHQLPGRSSNRIYTGNLAGNRRGIFVNNAIFTEDSESSSVITTEENIGGEQGQVNSSSCSFAAVPPPYPPPPPPPPPPPSPAIFDVSSSTSPAINYGAYLSTIPIFATNTSDGFHCVANESLANFEMDPLYFAPNMRSSFSSSSSSGFDGLTEFRDF